jgi:hypothetical protein
MHRSKFARGENCLVAWDLAVYRERSIGLTYRTSGLIMPPRDQSTHVPERVAIA